jgi:6,7-dimethyl-8-ribityllumazine synthase
MIEHPASTVGHGRRVGIVVSRFNETITKELLAGATECLRRQEVVEDAIVVAWVPGAWEIPAAVGRMARSGAFDAMIALGAVIRGETPHFDFIAGGVSTGLATLAVTQEVPIVFGVLTTDTYEQAFERAGLRAENRGADFALAALEMANLFDRLPT